MPDAPLISMTLIVKDEADKIERCLHSFWADVDEVVIVDTGSTDNTLTVARKFAYDMAPGDDHAMKAAFAERKLVTGEFKWCDDFAAARNAADVLATGTWLTWVDADDEIVGMGKLREMAEQAEPDVVGYFCHYDYATHEGSTVSELWRERLVRRDGPAWEGRLHEYKIFQGGKIIQVDPANVDWKHHHSEEADRGERNLRILEKWLADEPENPRVLSSIGLEHLSANRIPEGIDAFTRYLACPGEPADRRSQATRYLCVLLMQAGEFDRAKAESMRALGELWTWTDTHLTLAEVAQAQGDPATAIQHANTAQELGKPTSLLILNPVQYTAHPKAIIAICLAQQGRYEDALARAREVFDIQPGYHVIAPLVGTWQAALKHERTVSTYTAMAQQLVEHSEIEKAEQLLRAVPFFCADDPRVIEARVMVESEREAAREAEICQPRIEAFHNFIARQKVGVALDGIISEERIANVATTGAPLFVCAPDGVNQHRALRAYTAQDLASMLQRHGRFTHFAPTDDGHIIAGITPVARRGTVAIWTGWAIGPWHPTDILQRGLGGSETAAYRLAEELAAMGWAVTLYGQFETEAHGFMVGDVILKDFRRYDPTQHVDVFVGFRDAGRFATPINTDTAILWLEDVPGNERLTPETAENIDHVCCVSYWHRDAFREHYPWLDPEIVHACRNGVTLDFFDGPAPEREKRVLFTSSPDRGLDVLLECWPRIREQVPDAELLSTYSRWYDIVAEHYPKAFEHRETITRLLEQPGVRRLEGGMGQKDLAHLMRASLLWVHPSWYSGGDEPFNETSCISAMEAQAAGLAIIAAEQGALVDTVRVGELIPDPSNRRDENWRQQFIDHIVRALTDEAIQAHAQTAGPEAVKDCDWRGAAEQLAALFGAKVAA